MRDNFEVLAQRRLSNVILPGTHDSAAYVLAPVDTLNRRHQLMSLLSRFTKPCIAPWALTQQVCVYRQLSELGIRFLDLRVAWDDKRNDLMTSHTYECVPLKTILYDVIGFLAQQAGEVVALSVRPDWPHRAQFTPARSNDLFAALSSTCSGHLYPLQTELPTLAEMVEVNRRLIIFVEGLQVEPTNPAAVFSQSKPPDDIWISKGCNCVWADKDTAYGTVSGLLNMIANLRRDGRLQSATFWYVSAAVTPTARSVVRDILVHPRDAGLRRLAAQLEANELQRLLAEGLIGMGAVCLDYPSAHAAMAVVQLNLQDDEVSVSK